MKNQIKHIHVNLQISLNKNRRVFNSTYIFVLLMFLVDLV